MDPGDLVQVRDVAEISDSVAETPMGIVLEVRHPRASHPDYRTPTDVLVYFPDEEIEWNERWFHKQELSIVNSR